MRALLISTIFALILLGCSTTPTNPEDWMVRYENSCVPTAIAFRQGLVRQGIWARVFMYLYTYDGKDNGHAMTAFLYPPGKNQLWTYDSMGSWKTRAYIKDVRAIADYAHSVRGAKSLAYGAEWLD